MLTLAIQAGGKSSRMGKDKALMPFRGVPLIQYLMDRLAPIADEIIVTTNTPEDYSFLDAGLAPDLRLGRGALGGLYTALSAAKGDLVAVVACDMPFASDQFFLTASKLIVTSGADIVIPKTEYGYEPLHALYRRDACIPPIEAALDADKWKVISWFDQVKVHALSPEESAVFNPDGLTFWNLNTPEDFASAEKNFQS
ncbi:MAG: molybdenum cofactor guanylyltransferase [Anaerolineae bacterium]|nr:molybdenum cofactor guanylyltransferase [Anaerolineae bacterium]MBT3714497.1 molybdenum cofactor guanylyltransferase [Anaerolineae bacterium]MBT4312692.1 molybdenum cofactor guanylyltransferase [Anaerolineae bacterium]MBT4458577.1 molybdenum cofactor guanylyltransferase [Anaerolineae bacterium]MBT4843369.1 molybdenum cofactor guanylyltransferase [Anaerolineae bacterium]